VPLGDTYQDPRPNVYCTRAMSPWSSWQPVRPDRSVAGTKSAFPQRPTRVNGCSHARATRHHEHCRVPPRLYPACSRL